MLSPRGQLTKVCYAMICSLLFSRKESCKNKHLVLGMSERGTIIQNPTSGIEQNIYSFLLLVLDDNSLHSLYGTGNYWNNE